MKSRDVRVQDSVICGRKNCTNCGIWRHAYEFNYERRGTTYYMRSECQVCARKRRRDWYKKLSPTRKAKLHAIERQSRLRRNGSDKVDAWPVRRWLLVKINDGWTLNQLSEELGIPRDEVVDLARGYREDSGACDIEPIRTVEKRLVLRFVEVANMRRESLGGSNVSNQARGGDRR
jgi:hypothetical protein